MCGKAKKNALLFLLLLAGAASSANAAQSNYTGHDSFSVTSAVSVSEVSAVRFGNFSVSSPGDNGASIVLDINGDRTANQTGSTLITLLNGGISDTGGQNEGVYRVTGATGGASLYVSFTDHTGAAITGGNPVVLTGPVGSDAFDVDSFVFNNDGTDGMGDYILANGGGQATLHVGATLHTRAGASTYAPGQYKGTFSVVVSY